MEQEYDEYKERNETIRIDCFESLDEKLQVPLMTFFRRLSIPHVYWETIVPTLQEGNAMICAAVRDRPWPPWGLGAQKVHALLLVYPIGERTASLNNIFVADDDLTNIGLQSAVYKEALQHLIRKKKTEVNYVVLEGSIMPDRILASNGFKKTDDLFLTEEARYNLYTASSKDVLKKLGLADVSSPDLLSHEVDDKVFQRNALFHGMTQMAGMPFWLGRIRRPGLIFNGGGLFDANPPAGVPPSPSPPS